MNKKDPYGEVIVKGRNVTLTGGYAHEVKRFAKQAGLTPSEWFNAFMFNYLDMVFEDKSLQKGQGQRPAKPLKKRNS